MTKKLTEYTKQELQNAIDLISLRDDNKISLTSDIVLTYNDHNETIVINHVDHSSIIIPIESLSKIKKFVDCFYNNYFSIDNIDK